MSAGLALELALVEAGGDCFWSTSIGNESSAAAGGEARKVEAPSAVDGDAGAGCAGSSVGCGERDGASCGTATGTATATGTGGAVGVSGEVVSTVVLALPPLEPLCLPAATAPKPEPEPSAAAATGARGRAGASALPSRVLALA